MAELSTAEVVRERAAPAAETITAETPKPDAPDAIRSLLDFQSNRLKAYEQTFGTAEDRRAEIERAKEESARASGTAESVYQNVVVPALVRQVQAARLPIPTPPTMLPQPPVPSQQARPFMDVPEKQSLGAVVQTLGLMAQMAMAGKAPVAALGALTGAMEGWHQGDRERADREWRQYLGEVDKINRTNRDHMATFDAAMRTHTTNLQAAQAEVIASLYGNGHYEQAAKVARDGVVQAYNNAADLQNHIDKVWNDTIKLIEAHETRDLRLAMEQQRTKLQDAYHRDLIEQRVLDRQQREKSAADALRERTREFNERRQQAEGGETLSPQAIELAAQQYYTTGQLPAMGMGAKSTTAREKVMNRAGEIAASAGTTGADFVARTQFAKASQNELSALLRQRGLIMAFASTADQNLDAALELSKKVDRQGVPVINRWILAGRQSIQGDKDVTDFNIFNNRAVTEIARLTSSATGGGVSTDSARREAAQLLETAFTPEQYESAVKTLKQEVTFRRKGYEDQIKSVEQNVRRLLPQPQGAAPAGALTPPRPGMIRVRRKSDGQTGWLERKDLGDLYQEIEQ